MAQKTQKKIAKKVPKRITPTYLHNAGLYYLQRFAASRTGFERVLLRKIQNSCRHHKDQDPEECADMAREVAAKFERAGLLNDAAYAQGLVTSLRRSGKSKKAILAKMAVKGLKQDLSLNTLRALDDENHENPADAEFEAALHFARKKRLFKKEDPSKALAAMARAGFSYDIARKILEIKEPEDG